MRIYFAGPLFTAAEREWNTKLVNLISGHPDAKGLTFFLPQDNVSDSKASNIFKMCTDNIDKSDAVLAIMDGSDPDSGTCFECGYAYATDKPIFTLRSDFRYAGDTFDIRFNLMLTQSSTCIELKEMATTEEIVESVITVFKEHLYI